MKKFSNYKGFLTNPSTKLQHFTKTTHDALPKSGIKGDNSPPNPTTENDLTQHNFSDQACNCDLIAQNFDENNSDYGYNYDEQDYQNADNQPAEKKQVAISMKTRKLIQLSRAHDEAIKSILASANINENC